MIVFYNGTFIKDNSVDILPHLFDSFQGYFTTLKFANNKSYFLDKHIKRLKQTAKYLNFDFTEYNFDYIIRQLVQFNNRKRAKVRIIYFNPAKIRCLITLSNLETIDYPIKVKTKISVREGEDYKYKLLKNLTNKIYLDKANKMRVNDFLFIDQRGYLLEATFSNVFFLYDKRIFTPPDSQPILKGVIRNVLSETHLPNGYSVVKKQIHYSEISNFEEVFITNSIKGIVPIKQIDNFSYQTKKGLYLKNRIDL